MGLCKIFGVVVLAVLASQLPRISQSIPIPFLTHFDFDVDQIPDMTGKIVIVTGGNSGLGYVSAKEMARKGAKVIIGCRSESKAAVAISNMRKETGNEQLDVTSLPLVLDDLDSVRNFAKLFLASHSHLDVLMNNAGKFFENFLLTKQGVEGNMGVHHVGHFLLTHLLLPSLEAAGKVGAPARIVQVASHAHQQTKTIDFDDLKDPAKYAPMHRYAESKLANILFAREVSKRLNKAGKNVIINSCHPGFVITDFSWFQGIPGLDKIAYSMEGGALTQLHLATSSEFADYHITGQYYYPVGVQARYGVETSAAAHDEALQKKLWEWTIPILTSYDPNFKAM